MVPDAINIFGSKQPCMQRSDEPPLAAPDDEGPRIEPGRPGLHLEWQGAAPQPNLNGAARHRAAQSLGAVENAQYDDGRDAISGIFDGDVHLSHRPFALDGPADGRAIHPHLMHVPAAMRSFGSVNYTDNNALESVRAGLARSSRGPS